MRLEVYLSSLDNLRNEEHCDEKGLGVRMGNSLIFIGVYVCEHIVWGVSDQGMKYLTVSNQPRGISVRNEHFKTSLQTFLFKGQPSDLSILSKWGSQPVSLHFSGVCGSSG